MNAHTTPDSSLSPLSSQSVPDPAGAPYGDDTPDPAAAPCASELAPDPVGTPQDTGAADLPGDTSASPQIEGRTLVLDTSSSRVEILAGVFSGELEIEEQYANGDRVVTYRVSDHDVDQVRIPLRGEGSTTFNTIELGQEQWVAIESSCMQAAGSCTAVLVPHDNAPVICG